MRILRYLIILFVLYVGVVVAFESLLGYVQPENEGTIVLTTIDEDGNEHDRVLSLLETDGKEYVAVNHWPRAWWYRTKENPNVKMTKDGETRDYVAVTVSGAEHDRVQAENPIPLTMRFLMGFAPRYFVRLDPVEAGAEG